MDILWIGGGLLAAAVGALVLKKAGGGHRPAAQPSGHAPLGDDRRGAPAPRAVAAPTPAPAPAVTPAPAPTAAASAATLAAFHPVHAGELAADRRQVIVKVFHDIPRPPKLLHHLLSPDFVGSASSAELADLIAAEPVMAAKVLATVNSPLYGLRSPVGGIDQAVAYLGLTTVRSVCLQYILIASFKADSPERQRILDSTWNASALASELTRQLAHKLGASDQGALVSAVVLSFLGRLATAATMPRGVLATIPPRGLLERASAEQAKLGLPASEVGRLLMSDWGLPANVVDDAADIDRILVTPAGAPGLGDATRTSRLALCYLCARLGERLADGEMKGLATFDPRAETTPDFTNLASHLAAGWLADLTTHLQAPDLEANLQKMLQAMRQG